MARPIIRGATKPKAALIIGKTKKLAKPRGM